MPRWNPEILEKHIAPGISDFTEAAIPDLREDFKQSEHWLTNHFLNNAFRATLTPPIKQLVQNYIYRAEV